ncbi:claudin-14-like [Paramormyrops kingsleyae]|uniref:claudin-14-like n=1 Tax=Paramormyrops kingsleyae TaxID=1676925 RepID=UPI003B96A0E5
MAKMAVQLLGFFLGLLGLLGMVVTTLLPQWRRRAYIGSNIITATGYMKGLWMECVWHSTGIYQCQTHRSLLALPLDLQAARALMIISCVASILALALATVGMECTRLASHSRNKNTLAVFGGIGFIAAGLLCLVTVSWTTNDIVQQFYNPQLPSIMKYEIGQAVYLGFISALLSIAGGASLCLCSGVFLERRAHIPQASAAVMRRGPQAYQHPTVHKRLHSPSGFSSASDGYRVGDYV